MSAPVTERARTATRTRTAARPGPDAIPAQRTTSPAPHESVRASAKKAYARRDDRLRRVLGAGRVRTARTSTPAGRAQFVLLVMVLLTMGLVATLWLSTAAASDSYRLQDARAAAQVLTAQSERLHRDVASMSSAPALAQRAAQLGMVPVQNPARLVVDPSGAVTVVGAPNAAAAAPPVVAPIAKPAPAGAAPGPADGTAAVPDATDPNAAPGGSAPAAAQPGAAQPDVAAAQPGVTPSTPGATQPTTQPIQAARAAGTGTG